MILSISNIAWTADNDEKVYGFMKEHGFPGLEIAPTRIFAETPYEDLSAAERWKEDLQARYGFTVSSMQSIWYALLHKEGCGLCADDRMWEPGFRVPGEPCRS